MSEKFLRALFPHLSGDNGVLLRANNRPDMIWRGEALPEPGCQLLFSKSLVGGINTADCPARVFTASGTDLQDILRPPLAPTAVIKWRDTFTAFWVTSDEWPDEKPYELFTLPGYVYEQDTYGGQLCRLISLTPDLVYTRADVEASVDPAITALIRGGIAAVGPERTKRELSVIHALRKAGLSIEAICSIFEQQPIGDPYREYGSVVGHWTLVDELAQDILAHLDEGKFVAFEEKGIVWFHVASVLRWWYPFRREDGLPILPEKEMRLLLAEQSMEHEMGLGQYLRPGVRKVAPGTAGRGLFGIDLEVAAANGVVKGGETK